MNNNGQNDLENILAATGKTAASGAAFGGFAGAAYKLASKKKLAEIIRGMIAGAGAGGALSGGAQMAGSAVLGAPAKREGGTPYTVRGALGGSMIGGAAGGILGLLAATGRAGKISNKIPPHLIEMIPPHYRPIAGLVAGALLGGIPAAYTAADDASKIDLIENNLQAERDELERRKMLRGLAGRIYGGQP